eukprot:Platyproteum_vivax@DN15947_c0_g1_i1.p1
MVGKTKKYEKYQTKWWEHLVVNLVRVGPVPQHVAFVMDGNRRYAQKKFRNSAVVKNLNEISLEGHRIGSEKLDQTLELCWLLGVEAVTIFAFSLDNFGRSPEEVAGLFELAEEKFQDMTWHSDFLTRHGVCVKVLGDRSLLPLSLQKSIRNIEDRTRHHTKAILNICLAYSSSWELSTALDLLSETHPKPFNSPPSAASDSAGPDTPAPETPSPRHLVADRLLVDASDTTASGSEDLEKSSEDARGDGCGLGRHGDWAGTALKEEDDILDQFLFTAGCPPLDILIRTSGVTRLSDFLVWQARKNVRIYFLKSYWPDLSMFCLLLCFLQWQLIKMITAVIHKFL